MPRKPETVPKDVIRKMTTRVIMPHSNHIRQLELLHPPHSQELPHNQEAPTLMLHGAAIKTTFKCGTLQWLLNSKEVSHLKVSSVDFDNRTVTRP